MDPSILFAKRQWLEDQEEDADSDDVAIVAERFTRTKKINLLRDACYLLNVFKDGHQAAYRVLRDLQLDIRNAPTTQTTLDMWFK
ncbi:unnamed protein product [Peronospora effusa]|nr:unnamed protein product [Peronospora effusa]